MPEEKNDPSRQAQAARKTVEIVEDWQQDHKPPHQDADPSLEGFYTVTHGTLYFSAEKTVKKGRTVRLSARDAHRFLHLDQPEETRQESLVRKVA